MAVQQYFHYLTCPVCQSERQRLLSPQSCIWDGGIMFCPDHGVQSLGGDRVELVPLQLGLFHPQRNEE
jgi:hypothetical protein